MVINKRQDQAQSYNDYNDDFDDDDKEKEEVINETNKHATNEQ